LKHTFENENFYNEKFSDPKSKKLKKKLILTLRKHLQKSSFFLAFFLEKS
jgi:hypothetical protein